MSPSEKAPGIPERATLSPAAVSVSAGGDHHHRELDARRDPWRTPPLVGAENAE